ncbi:hypothetical protein D3C76_978480 [compost metagenome]
MRPVRSFHPSAKQARSNNGNSRSVRYASVTIVWRLSSVWRSQAPCCTCSVMSQVASTCTATAQAARPLTSELPPRSTAAHAWCAHGVPPTTRWNPLLPRIPTASWYWTKSACAIHASSARRSTCSVMAPARPAPMTGAKLADRCRSGACCFSLPARRPWPSTWPKLTRN